MQKIEAPIPAAANLGHAVFELPMSDLGPGKRGVRARLAAHLRAAILDGRLAEGLQLPASRAFAEGLGVSRGAVMSVYDSLVAAGLLEARTGAGTFVARRSGPAASPGQGAPAGVQAALAGVAWLRPTPLRTPHLGAPVADLRVGLPDCSQLRFDIWRRLSMRSVRRFARTPTGYMTPEGLPELREAIVAHISYARAVACAPDDVLITAGAQAAFHVIACALASGARGPVAVEDPGYPPLWNAFRLAGAKLAPCPVDEQGLVVSALPRDASMVCVTPSHQFPLGAPMSAERRRELLAFAHETGAIIVEDDYDGEFRLAGRPLDALKTTDAEGRVVFVGTFSKSLFPGLRLGFVIAPPWARAALAGVQQAIGRQPQTLDQQTLAAFIDEGHLARHVRRMRRVYASRRQAMLRALEDHLGATFDVTPNACGLHLAATPRPGRAIDVAAVARRCADQGVHVDALDRFAMSDRPREGLALSYALASEARIEAAMGRIAEIVKNA